MRITQSIEIIHNNQGMSLLLTIGDGDGLGAWLRVAVFLQENVESR